MSCVKIHHLRYFIAIANEKSLRAAARSLNLAQSALSRGLRELELDLGTELVERHGRGIHLTKSGERYLVHAKGALEELRRGFEEAAQLRGDEQCSLTVGISTLAQMALLPRALPLFRQKFPHVNLTIDGSLLPQLAPRIDDGSMDFCIVPRLSGDLDRRFQSTKLWSSERGVLARRGHPLEHATTLEDLCHTEWVGVGERRNVEYYIRTLFEKNGLHPPTAISIVDSVPSATAFVQASDAVIVCPKYITLINNDIIEINIRQKIENIDIILVKKHGLPLTVMAEYFLSILRRVAGNIYVL